MKFIRKHLLLIVVVITLLFVGAGIYFGRALNEQNNALREEANGQKERLQAYYQDTENAPSPYLVRKLERQKTALESSYETLAGRYAILPFLALPEQELFPTLYYKETVYYVLDNLYRRAEAQGVALPGSLGIPETGLPEPETIPTLFVLLDTAKRFCEEVFIAGLAGLDSIQLQSPIANPLFIEVPFVATVSGSSSRVAYFIESLGSSQTIFVLENIQMSGEPDNIQAAMSLKRILWGVDFAEKLTAVSMPSASPGGGPGGGEPQGESGGGEPQAQEQEEEFNPSQHVF